MTTLSSLSDSSTVVGAASAAPFPPFNDYTRPEFQATQQPLSRPRFTGDVMMDNAHVGPKDSKNTRLTLENSIRVASSDKTGTRNPGELYNRISESYLFDKSYLPKRGIHQDQHGPDSFVNDGDRANMKRVVNLHDPSHSVNAMPSRNFEFGGSTTNNDPYSFIGANNSVPIMSISELTRNPGLDHTHFSDYSDFSKFDRMAKENFMKRLSERFILPPKHGGGK